MIAGMSLAFKTLNPRIKVCYIVNVWWCFTLIVVCFPIYCETGLWSRVGGNAQYVPVGSGRIRDESSQKQNYCRLHNNIHFYITPTMLTFGSGSFHWCFTLPDGIAVEAVGEIPFALAHKYVDQIVLVDEDEVNK